MIVLLRFICHANSSCQFQDISRQKRRSRSSFGPSEKYVVLPGCMLTLYSRYNLLRIPSQLLVSKGHIQRL